MTYFRGEDFRLDFGNLGDLGAYFPGRPIVAMTATATPKVQATIIEKLHLRNVAVIQECPDRPNISLRVCQRESNIDPYLSYSQIIEPLALELTEKRLDFPVTICYVRSKFACGEVYDMIKGVMGAEMYHTIDEKPNVKHRFFAQFHAKTTKETKAVIIAELTKSQPRMRFVVATVALGMGLDCPSIERIVHIRPPTRLGSYFQEIGRAGRDGRPATAILHYNNSDIAQNTGVEETMRTYCRGKSCLRRQLMDYFGFCYKSVNADCCSACIV